MPRTAIKSHEEPHAPSADPSSRAMACEEGLDQALAFCGRCLAERDLVAVDLQRDPGVGVAADPPPQGREQRSERAGEPDDELRPIERCPLCAVRRGHLGVRDLLDALPEHLVAQPARELGPLLVVAVRQALHLNAQLRHSETTVTWPHAARKNRYRPMYNGVSLVRLTFSARPVAGCGLGPKPPSGWLT